MPQAFHSKIMLQVSQFKLLLSATHSPLYCHPMRCDGVTWNSGNFCFCRTHKRIIMVSLMFICTFYIVLHQCRAVQENVQWMVLWCAFNNKWWLWADHCLTVHTGSEHTTACLHMYIQALSRPEPDCTYRPWADQIICSRSHHTHKSDEIKQLSPNQHQR